MSPREQVRMTQEEWHAEGVRRFGSDQMGWKFVCPSCKSVVTPHDYKAAGAPENAVAFSCVGRWIPKSTATFGETRKGVCNYAGGGLFRLNPITVTDGEGQEHEVFEFAPA